MSHPGDDIMWTIAAHAMDYIRASDDLHALRNGALQCEHEESGESEPHTGHWTPAVLACWREVEAGVFGLDNECCDNCRETIGIRAGIPAAKKARDNARTRMRCAVKRFWAGAEEAA